MGQEVQSNCLEAGAHSAAFGGLLAGVLFLFVILVASSADHRISMLGLATGRETHVRNCEMLST